MTQITEHPQLEHAMTWHSGRVIPSLWRGTGTDSQQDLIYLYFYKIPHFFYQKGTK